ncbi:hypothetical protein KCG44_03845 [Pacificimonas sp. WHA3]|uniref:Uncharacterized protein n=1 Tax=Pacificimonas pallii TaxID=2827236 RepID=A0ABS6SBW3_9SPHN|nr:hypothetical protein [Pacificimonas pallii]MBV7255913.1 hypothetical protein [Pacificimonas pallii]
MKLTRNSLLTVALLLVAAIALAIYTLGIPNGNDTGGKLAAGSRQMPSSEFEQICRPEELSPSMMRIGSWSVPSDSIKQVSWRVADGAMMDVEVVFALEAVEQISRETSSRIGKSLALSIDGVVVSEPIVNEAISAHQMQFRLPTTDDSTEKLVWGIAPACAEN